MSKSYSNSKLLALRVFTLSRAQRDIVAGSLGGFPRVISDHINEIEIKFPHLNYLTEAQRYKIYESVIAQYHEADGWELLQDKLDLLKPRQSNYPSKLHAMMFEL